MGINYTDCYWKQMYEPLTLGANHNNFNYTKGSISRVKTFQILPFLLSYFKTGQNYKVSLKTQDGVEGYFPSSEIPPPYMHSAKPSLAGITFISSSWRNFWRAVLPLSLEYATLCKMGLWISFWARELEQPCASPVLPLPEPNSCCAGHNAGDEHHCSGISKCAPRWRSSGCWRCTQTC